MSLKELTSDLHRKAEKMPFNQKMFRGELSSEEYLKYLHQQYHIFKAIEYYKLPNDSLKRLEYVLNDIEELGTFKFDSILESTKKYVNHLLELNQENILPHVYLNYLALLFGGQMIKSKVPGEGKMYHFENMNDCVKSIRELQKDEWSNDVNKGFQFIINILDELQENT